MAGDAHRKRLHRYEIARQYRYLTFSCYQRLPLLVNDRIKRALLEQMIRARQMHRFALAAWVIMPEHVHLILRPHLPDSPVPVVLNAIKSPLSQRVLAHWRAVQAPILARLAKPGPVRFWQAGGGYDRNIFSEQELWEKIEYVHANPVRRGLVGRVVDWPWSSARWHEGERDEPIAMDPITL